MTRRRDDGDRNEKTTMPLTLRAVSLNDQPLTQPITARFGAEGGTIGRADHNTLALPDPERHISRLQAQIVTSGGCFLIKNVGSANPILVRGQPVARGDSSMLAPNDEVRIGGYLLEVLSDDPFPGHTVTRPLVHRAPLSTTSSFKAPLSGANPFADLLGAKAAEAPAAQGLPADFDPFARPSEAAARAPVEADALAQLAAPQGPAPSLDQMFGLSGEADPFAGFLTPAGVGSAAKAPLDPLAMFEPGGKTVEASPPVPDHVSQLKAGYRPPRVTTPAPEIPTDVDWLSRAPAPPPPAATPRDAPQADTLEPPPHAAPNSSEAELWQAFCEGAGVHLEAGRTLDAPTMRLIGDLLRRAVDGTHRLMMLRATTKSELGADVTMIHAQRNNPLKFSPDGQGALEQMLCPPLRGFLPGPAAMSDAMRDLLSHHIATMAGMRAAMEGMLKRFSPEALESRLTSNSVLDSVLPMNRRARLWQLYLQHYEVLRNEAQDDFHALFGKAFLNAYEYQLQRLEQDTNAEP